jgi:hypothetical protein
MPPVGVDESPAFWFISYTTGGRARFARKFQEFRKSAVVESRGSGLSESKRSLESSIGVSVQSWSWLAKAGESGMGAKSRPGDSLGIRWTPRLLEERESWNWPGMGASPLGDHMIPVPGERLPQGIDDIRARIKLGLRGARRPAPRSARPAFSRFHPPLWSAWPVSPLPPHFYRDCPIPLF